MTATYTPIASATVGTAVATVTFTSIPQTYTDLVLVINAGLTSGAADASLQFNSDTGNNYSRVVLYGNGTSAFGARNASVDSIITIQFGALSDGPLTTTHIMNYSNTTTYKSLLQRGGYASSITALTAGLWRNTNAITRIDVGNRGGTTYVAGSTFNLYGILGANA
jgi:hypothetical protein